MKPYQLVAALTLLAFAFAPSCGSSDPLPQKPQPAAPGGSSEPAETEIPEKPTNGGATEETKYTAKEKRLAKTQFQTYCFTCHGKDGKGDGPAGQALNPKPRNWTDQEWQKKVTDQHLFEIIRDGGAAHGLSPAMAANPMYRNQPGVLWALVDMVRGYRE